MKNKRFFDFKEYSFERIAFLVIGIFFVFIGLYSFYSFFSFDDISLVLWFCYTGTIVIGIGFILNKNSLVVSQLNILFFPLIIWSIDFFYEFFVGSALWGLTSYFFQEGDILRKLIILQHIYTIPISFFALARGSFFSRWVWVYSFIQAIVFFIVTRTFVKDVNVNWVLNRFPNLIGSDLLYVFLWVFFMFIFCLLTNFILYKIFIEKKVFVRLINKFL